VLAKRTENEQRNAYYNTIADDTESLTASQNSLYSALSDFCFRAPYKYSATTTITTYLTQSINRLIQAEAQKTETDRCVTNKTR